METKIVTAYWMDCEGLPFQGCASVRKGRYIGSLISHCQNINLPTICYTHEKNYQELEKIKNDYELKNLELKILELYDVKYHKQINDVRYGDLDRYVKELDGRGCEIMWGKFDILERELINCDKIYWIDVGLQHPGILKWGNSKKYNKPEYHKGPIHSWWTDYDVYNFPNFFNRDVINKLNEITENKLVLLASNNPQISYHFQHLGITDYPFSKPYPVGAIIGGNTEKVKKYVNLFWYYAEKLLQSKNLFTEEAVMKPSFDDMDPSEVITFTFDNFHCCEHDKFHFEKWDKSWNEPKPLYMTIYDILEYTNK